MLKLECNKFIRILYEDPNSNWVTNENLLDTRSYYKNELDLTEKLKNMKNSPRLIRHQFVKYNRKRKYRAVYVPSV